MYKIVLSTAAALFMSAATVAPVLAQSASGAYLAGRSAAVNSDYREAARYYTQALARDSQNVELMEAAALANLSLGKVDNAVPLARQLESQGQRSQIAHLVITAGLAQEGNFAELVKRPVASNGINQYVDNMMRAWARLGAGDTPGAMADFDRLSKEPGIQGFVLYHKALALASIGDFEGAEAIFGSGGAGAAGQTRRGTIAHAEILAAMGRFEDATTLLTTSFADGTDPELDGLIAKYATGEVGEYAYVKDARDGIAEVFFTFAIVLRSENAGDYFVLLYSRVARYLREDHMDSLLLSASLLEGLGQYDLAIEEYGAVTAENPVYHAAELGRSGALRRAGRPEEAIAVLEKLATTHGDLPGVHSTLGDVLRGQEDFSAAIKAYDRALDLVVEGNPTRWVLNYSRGIAHERNDDMDSAEADFRAALALNPEQPQVLNYLGYSLVEEQRNLEEALDMIERAVKASPDSGYIVDSLGWVYYRLGRYEEAVPEMEKAVELLPVDPVVNDHLGDVYWAVGRAREAEFQWSRALSFIDPEETDSEADPDRIRRKLEVGLDKVLEEEGADPLKVAEDG